MRVLDLYSGTGRISQGCPSVVVSIVKLGMNQGPVGNVSAVLDATLRIDSNSVESSRAETVNGAARLSRFLKPLTTIESSVVPNTLRLSTESTDESGTQGILRSHSDTNRRLLSQVSTERRGGKSGCLLSISSVGSVSSAVMTIPAICR